MTDIQRILPAFPTRTFVSLLPILERHAITTSDLLSLDASEIHKRTLQQAPVTDVRRLCAAVTAALHESITPTPFPLGSRTAEPKAGETKDAGNGSIKEQDGDARGEKGGAAAAFKDQDHDKDEQQAVNQHLDSEPASPSALPVDFDFISTLDDSLDHALGGGFPTGYVSEVTGESGAAKTQLLLTLLLAVQLPPPRGLGRPALYLSTEASLATTRLAQILSTHPSLAEHRKQCRMQRTTADNDGGDKLMMDVTLDNIVSTVTPDLESQDHILTYQVPVEIERRNVGLLVLDSVAANYRAEYEMQRTRGPRHDSTGTGTGTGTLGNSAGANAPSMAARGNELVRLGALLHNLARKHNLAVVVSNQVSDRISSATLLAPSRSQSGFILRHLTPTSTQTLPTLTQESPLASRSRPPAFPALPFSSVPEPTPPLPPFSLSPDHGANTHPALLLDHQQRWFTGWGDECLATGHGGEATDEQLKTPSLGLVWSTQVACRVALLRTPVYSGKRRAVSGEEHGHGETGAPGAADAAGAALGVVGMTMTGGSWRRWMKVVFAPHVAATGGGLDGAVEFEVTAAGLRAINHDIRNSIENAD